MQLLASLDSSHQTLGLTLDIMKEKWLFQIRMPRFATPNSNNAFSAMMLIFYPRSFLSLLLVTGKLLPRRIIAKNSEWDKVISCNPSKDWNSRILSIITPKPFFISKIEPTSPGIRIYSLFKELFF
jgi:hypothetical protein